jgi:hypothetical protein
VIGTEVAARLAKAVTKSCDNVWASHGWRHTGGKGNEMTGFSPALCATCER